MNSSRTVMVAVATLVAFVAGIALGWMFGRAHPPLPDIPTVAMYNGWRLACPAASKKDAPCVISNDLVEAKTNRRVAQLTLLPAKKGAVLIVTTPFDVLLPAGVGLVLGDAKPRAYPYVTCNGAGCIAQIPVDDTLRAQLRQTGQAKLLVGSLDRKTVQIVFSLDGFARADDAMKARKHGHSLFGMAI